MYPPDWELMLSILSICSGLLYFIVDDNFKKVFLLSSAFCILFLLKSLP